MTTVQTKEPTKKNARSKAAKSNGICGCEDKPQVTPFIMPALKGGNLIGNYCGICYQVIDWKHEPKADEPKSTVSTPKEAGARQQSSFRVTKVMPVKKKDDVMAFMCEKETGGAFTINVQSTKEKVTNAINKPTIIEGKYALIEHNGFDQDGNPKDAEVKAVKSKDKLPKV